MTIEIEQHSNIARGHRLRIAREMSGLTATKLAELAQVSRCTVSYWENAHVGLTRKGAEKVIDALLKEGIRCELGWLWLGEGQEPIYISSQTQNKNSVLTDIEMKEKKIHLYTPISSLEREIALFLSLNENAVAVKCEDELMQPLFTPSDIIGGIWRDPTLVQNGQLCIIKSANILRVRQIKKTKKGFEILHIHPKATEYLNPKEIDFTFVAPVIRLWRH